MALLRRADRVTRGGARLGRVDGDLAAQDPERELDRVGRIRPASGCVVRLDLEELDAHETVVLAVGPPGEAMPFGPLAGQGRVGPAQVRAILGIVGQQDLRGMAMDRPFLGPLRLAVVGEVGVRLGQGTPGRPAGEDHGVGEVGPDQADGGQGAGHAVRHVRVVGRRHDHGAGTTLW